MKLGTLVLLRSWQKFLRQVKLSMVQVMRPLVVLVLHLKLIGRVVYLASLMVSKFSLSCIVMKQVREIWKDPKALVVSLSNF